MVPRSIDLGSASAFLVACMSLASHARDLADFSVGVFGCSVAGCRDLEQRDRTFLIIGSPLPRRDLLRAEGLTPEGRTLLEEYRGAVWIFPRGSAEPVRCISGFEYGDRLGQVVGSLPDIDGDGIEDAFAFADTLDRERAYVLVFSPATGNILGRIAAPLPPWHPSVSACRLDAPHGNWRIAVGAPLGLPERGEPCTVAIVGMDGLVAVVPSLSTGDRFGSCLASCGDVDGDGFDDLAIGAPQATVSGIGPSTGSVSIISGADGSRLLEIVGEARFERFGTSIACIADVDGDGRRDLAIGAPASENGQNSHGAVRIFRLRDGMRLREIAPRMDRPRSEFEAAIRGRFGIHIVEAADVDGDGCGDFASLTNNSALLHPSRKERARVGFALLESSLEPAAWSVKSELVDEYDFNVTRSWIDAPAYRTLASVPDQDGDGWNDIAATMVFQEEDCVSVRVLSSREREEDVPLPIIKERRAWAPLLGKAP